MRVLALCAFLVLILADSAPAQSARPDRQMQAVLDEWAALNPKPLQSLTPEEARKQPGAADAVKSLLKKQGKGIEPEPVGGVKTLAYPAAAGELSARIFMPKGNGPFPVLVYFHGGGWVIGDIDTCDASCRALCNSARCVVGCCDYRRAPENPFPAAADDAFAAYRWALKNCRDWNGDPTKVAIGGEDAGGNLAAVTCLRARDVGPIPVQQLLVYPVTNNDLKTPSYQEHARAKPLSTAMMKWFLAQYVGDQSPTPYSFPLRARDLTKLPAATVITADIDPLRDDGKEYAVALRNAGVRVAYKNFHGMTHEFFGMGAVLEKSKDAVKFAADGLTRAFGR